MAVNESLESEIKSILESYRKAHMLFIAVGKKDEAREVVNESVQAVQDLISQELKAQREAIQERVLAVQGRPYLFVDGEKQYIDRKVVEVDHITKVLNKLEGGEL